MFKKIQTKLVLSVSLLLSITLIGVSLFTYFDIRKEITSQVNSSSKELANNLKSKTDLYLKFYGSTVERYSEDNRIIDYLKQIEQNENQGITTHWPIVDNDFQTFMNQNKNVAVIFVGAKTKQFKTTPVVELPVDFDPTSRPWYSAAIQSPAQTVWTEPYIDASTGQYVVTVVKTVMDPQTNEVLGVVGLDLNLAGLTEIINNTHVDYKGYSFLIDTQGIALVHPSEQGKDLSKKSFYAKLKNADAGSTLYTNKGLEHETFYQTLDQTGWKIGMDYKTGELFKSAQKLSNLILLISSIAVIIGIIITYILARTIAKPIMLLNKQVQQVANGDLTVSVKINSKDEIGQLTFHFNEMVNNIRTLITSVEKSIMSVNDSAAQLTSISEETIASSEEVSRAISEVARGAAQQAQDSEETNKRAILLSSQIERVNGNADHMTELSRLAKETNQTGLDQMQSLRQKNLESEEVIKSVGEAISQLVSRIKEIEQINHSITEISNQTDLLALNASIEAARAGESGKGFAVVAEEVRKLAVQSSGATQQVKKTISNINHETQALVKKMEQTITISSIQKEAVGETEVAFNQISHMIHDMVISINSIKEDVDSINTLKDNVVTSIQSISAVAEQSAAASEQVSASTEEQVNAINNVTQSVIELSEASTNLSEMIKHFKI
ncbi:methyl-accepting chemotaxis protein [Neobacillus citreus]|uniref:Methyl-accepting chemotaxis protein n=1 Tax=Neobacillus citreus TaxID=2833578 RepID=A0A942YG24_9BACI|nr:methyl-accepting chemotaxis protein [Neobacillus citreus]